MKKLILVAAITLITTAFALGQSKDEQDILKFIADYDTAYINNNIAFAESVWANDYVFSDSDGSVNRTASLEELRKKIAKPTYKTLSLKSVNETMHIVGKTAVVSGYWTSSTVPVGELNAEPHIDKGRYTMAMEKIGSKWMVIAEHVSDFPHDKKLMEEQVIAASKLYDAAMKSRDRAAYELLLHKDYMFTNEDGKLISRADDIAHFASGNAVIATAETTDQKVRITSNSTAVETGMYHVTGTSKGKPFDETGRYTTTWVWREMRWQIIADHTSHSANK